jgi:Protein of unknown function (DUF3667)
MPGARTVRANAVEPWTCPSCRQPITTPYCPSCGERPRSPRDLTLRGLVDQAFEAFTNIDGRLLRSVRCLIVRPGALTAAFIEGRRTPYLGPVALFLVANAVFFAAESLTGGLVFTTPLQSHVQNQPWSGPAQSLVAAHLASHHTTLDAYAPRFDGAVALHARSLILLMALAFAPLPALVFRRRGHPAAVHAVFSLHLYAFMLLLFSIATAIPAAGMLFGHERSTSPLLDAVLSIGLLLACAGYLYVAIGAVYSSTRASRLLSAIVLTAGVAVIVLGYRFALLLLTLYTT